MRKMRKVFAAVCTTTAIVSATWHSSIGAEQARVRESFDWNWKFHRGDTDGCEKVAFDDSAWRNVDMPHDWSIEGNMLSSAEPLPEIAAVPGKWRFRKGHSNGATAIPTWGKIPDKWRFGKNDNAHWKQVDFDDSKWQEVQLPASWQDHSDYRDEAAFGWYRRKIVIPEKLKDRDIMLVIGIVADVDRIYFNGKKIGGLGRLPPEYLDFRMPQSSAVNRKYRVPKELINFGADNVIAIRAFALKGGLGGIYGVGGPYSPEGLFDPGVPGGFGHGYLHGGIGWYRKNFTMPETIKGKHVFVQFDGIYMDSDVWINGHHLGKRPYGYTTFQYELTPFLKYGKEPNVLAVRANVQQPCSRWYSGAGIYRHVWLTVTEPVHVAHWGTYVTTPEVSDAQAAVRVRTNIRNRSDQDTNVTLETIILDNSGKQVATSTTLHKIQKEKGYEFDQSLKIAKPRLWSVDDPYMYKVNSVVKEGGKVLDEYATPLGVRTFRFTKDSGFFLNEKHVTIKGVCLHHDLGCIGAAAYERAIERQLEIMREMGCNAIRTSHNPPAPKLLEICDRMGFLVMDEAFDEWTGGKTRYGYARFFDEWSEPDLVSMIQRDRNHPSVIMWSIGNEIKDMTYSNAYELSKRLADICHREDPTRPVTAGLQNLSHSEERLDAALRTGFTKPLDVVGINYNIDYYKKWRGTAKLIASETVSAVSVRGGSGTAGGYNRAHPETWGQLAESRLKAVKQSPWLAGEFVWTGFDYIGEPSPAAWPSRSSYFGIVDLCGFPKDRFYLYQSQWSDKPMVHILPHWSWSINKGAEIPVLCYSNCDSVELFVNGKSLEEKDWSSTEDLHLDWKVPWQPGKLKAVGKKNGTVVCTDEVHTAMTPARIILTADRTEIRTTGQDLSFVTARIVDESGHLCTRLATDNTINFRISGNGSILGVGNGDPTNHEYFKAEKHKTFHGLCLIVVKSTKQSGEIHLTATAKGLRSDKITIKASHVPERGKP